MINMFACVLPTSNTADAQNRKGDTYSIAPGFRFMFDSNSKRDCGRQITYCRHTLVSILAFSSLFWHQVYFERTEYAMVFLK
jgi:hypothetical protein